MLIVVLLMFVSVFDVLVVYSILEYVFCRFLMDKMGGGSIFGDM